jgi:hypothetical protein
MILEYIVSYPQQSKASEHEQHSLDQLGELTGHNAIRYCHCSSGKLAVNGTYIHSKHQNGQKDDGPSGEPGARGEPHPPKDADVVPPTRVMDVDFDILGSYYPINRSEKYPRTLLSDFSRLKVR